MPSMGEVLVGLCDLYVAAGASHGRCRVIGWMAVAVVGEVVAAKDLVGLGNMVEKARRHLVAAA